MRFALCLVAIAGCTGAPKQDTPVVQRSAPAKPGSPTVDPSVATLKTYLAEAREQSEEYLSGDALPAGKNVRALVDTDARAWWSTLTPLESFFLFEISPTVAARAPADVRAAALCAGVRDVFAAWWSVPGSSKSETTQHLLSSDAPTAPCLVELFENATPIRYAQGETDLEAEQFHWTRGDLAAGLVALFVNEKYPRYEAPEARAARRSELRAKVK